ncbi:type II secretion system GspH family protein [bacterium]|nr:type II secretion system GspH family protein [bacterium]
MLKFNKKFKRELKGFSLIEVVVAMSILMVAFIGLVQSFPLGNSINDSSQKKTTASYLAQEKIESLYSSGYDNIATGTIEIKHRLSSDKNDFFYKYQRETEVYYMDENLNASSSDTGLKRITTRVYYLNTLTKGEENIIMNTLISKH